MPLRHFIRELLDGDDEATVNVCGSDSRRSDPRSICGTVSALSDVITFSSHTLFTDSCNHPFEAFLPMWVV